MPSAEGQTRASPLQESGAPHPPPVVTTGEELGKTQRASSVCTPRGGRLAVLLLLGSKNNLGGKNGKIKI